MEQLSITTRGAKTEEIKTIANLIDSSIINSQNEFKLLSIKKSGNELMSTKNHFLNGKKISLKLTTLH